MKQSDNKELEVLFTDEYGTEIKSDNHYYFNGVKSKLKSTLTIQPKTFFTAEQRADYTYELLANNTLTENQYLKFVENGALQ